MSERDLCTYCAVSAICLVRGYFYAFQKMFYRDLAEAGLKFAFMPSEVMILGGQGAVEHKLWHVFRATAGKTPCRSMQKVQLRSYRDGDGRLVFNFELPWSERPVAGPLAGPMMGEP